MDSLDKAALFCSGVRFSGLRGISNYSNEQTKVAIDTLKKMGMHLLIHQANYSMLNRWVEDGLTDTLEREGVGCIAFCPLAQGLLTNRYLSGFPADSRAIHDPRYINKAQITEEKLNKIRQLNVLALQRGQSLAQMALAWTVRQNALTSALIGASKPEQVIENTKALENATFTDDELSLIDTILG